MGNPRLLESNKPRLCIMFGLLVVAGCLTFLFVNILETGIIFTHFFYIPIILVCVWWQKRGLFITFFLTLLLMAGQCLFAKCNLTVNDGMRVVMLFIISIIAAVLSERLNAAQIALSVSEEKYRTIFENTGTAMMIIENDRILSLVNREFEKLSGLTKQMVEKKMSITDFVAAPDREKVRAYHRQRRSVGNTAPHSYGFGFLTQRQQVRDVYVTIDLISGTDKSVASLLDVTEFKRALESKRILQEQLNKALEKVLSGFIPICAQCKKIRDEDENWVQIELFLEGRTNADFSHGICPDCAKRLYPEIYQ